MNNLLKIVLFLVLLVPWQLVKGQDRIITVQKDTLYCWIVSVSATQIHYEQTDDSDRIVGRFIPIEQVLEFQRKYKSVSTRERHRPKRDIPKPENRWVVGIQGGRSLLLRSTTDDENNMIIEGYRNPQVSDYYKQLKNGWSFSGNIHYLFSENFGLGVKYSFFTSSAEEEFLVRAVPYFWVGGYQYLQIWSNEKQFINFAGPSVIFMQWLDKNNKFQMTETLSAGFVHYRNELRTTFDNLLAQRSTWGANAGLTLSYFPLSWLSVGANMNFIYSRLIKIDISDKDYIETLFLEKDNYFYLTRFDYMININFHF